jgi:hypothetical protein
MAEIISSLRDEHTVFWPLDVQDMNDLPKDIPSLRDGTLTDAVMMSRQFNLSRSDAITVARPFKAGIREQLENETVAS